MVGRRCGGDSQHGRAHPGPGRRRPSRMALSSRGQGDKPATPAVNPHTHWDVERRIAARGTRGACGGRLPSAQPGEPKPEARTTEAGDGVAVFATRDRTCTIANPITAQATSTITAKARTSPTD